MFGILLNLERGKPVSSKFKGLSYEVIHNGDTIPTDPEAVWFESAVCPQCSSGDKQEKDHRDGELTRTFICRNCNCVYRATVNGIKQPKEKKEKHKPKNQNSFINKIIRGLNKKIVTTEQFLMNTAVVSALLVVLSMFIKLFDKSDMQQPLSLQNNFDVLTISFLCMTVLSFFCFTTYEIVNDVVEDVKE
jgi:hypothetical protein